MRCIVFVWLCFVLLPVARGPVGGVMDKDRGLGMRRWPIIGVVLNLVSPQVLMFQICARPAPQRTLAPPKDAIHECLGLVDSAIC